MNKKNADQRKRAGEMRDSASTMRTLTNAAKGRQTTRREDVNQAAARSLRESAAATEQLRKFLQHKNPR